MPIESPDLDDLRFDRTVEELRRRIPVYAPEWTDHNDSDPGIALIQLFAYLTEQIGYRLNRVPEKNHVELLKLLGARRRPAHAARTRLALLLDAPSTLTGYTLEAGARAHAQRGDPPPVFETDADADVVPAQPVLFVTTKNPYLHDVLGTASGPPEQPSSLPDTIPNDDTEWLTVVWDGGTPKLKDMSIDPVAVGKRAGHRYLWIGLDFNRELNAGFRGVRVTLTVQLDDDEQPDLAADGCRSAPSSAGTETPSSVDFLAYYDAEHGADGDVLRVPGRIDDTTAGFTRSGSIRFGVPFTLGAIRRFHPMRTASPVSPLDVCLESSAAMQERLSTIGDPQARDVRTIVQAGIDAARSRAESARAEIGHPLSPALQAKAKGWLRIELPPAGSGTNRIRMISFNTVQATHALTVNRELVGRGDGRPGQTYPLAHRNVLAGTLVIAMQESIDPAEPLVSWSEVDSLDGAGPFDSVYELDPEAGVVTFGDGTRGRIPPLVPRAGEIVALRYRYGGGLAGEVPVAAITALDPGAVGSAVNFVAATGGRDAETLDQVKLRARKELSTRTRAVTSGDFAWIAQQTPDVRVARAEVIPLRRPLSPSQPARAEPPRGLDDRLAPGAVTVVVVPEEGGPEPVPAPSFLRAVCRQLDAHRLVTTELHVASPQYCRLYNLLVRVRGRPGYTRSRIQGHVEARLGAYFHVLTGGEDQQGFPFGAQVHIADLMTQVSRTEGVERVEQLTAEFVRTKSNASPPQGQLLLCPTGPGQLDRIELSPEETVSIDVTTLHLSTTS